MKRLKTSELSELSRDDLVKKLNDVRSELSRLRSKAARGTLKKELGEIKTVRRNIARINTAISLDRIRSASEGSSEKSNRAKSPE